MTDRASERRLNGTMTTASTPTSHTHKGRVATASEPCDCTDVVREWLEVNSQRFKIPGTEWGRDLLGSLWCLLDTSEVPDDEPRTVITRPNGKKYRPRAAPSGVVIGPEDDAPDGVLVFGTHDPAVALPVARQAIHDHLEKWYDGGLTLKFADESSPKLVWRRKQLVRWDRSDSPRFNIIDDPERGRAGVYWEIHEEEVRSWEL